MRTSLIYIAACILGLTIAGAAARAQQPPVPAPPQTPVPAGAPQPANPASAASVVVAKPTYTSIVLEIAVDRPAADVWKRVGKYCDIGEWLRVACTITSGKDGEVGAVRSIGGEVLVGKTELSYTYTQPPREGRPYNLYHGTLEARPVTATTSKIVYTLFFDNSMLADDAAREADKARRTTQFTTAIQNMKILAEGGTLPPAAGRGRSGGQ
jgi:polyketide cyclase/dehydrase/lipid transport protein